MSFFWHYTAGLKGTGVKVISNPRTGALGYEQSLSGNFYDGAAPANSVQTLHDLNYPNFDPKAIIPWPKGAMDPFVWGQPEPMQPKCGRPCEQNKDPGLNPGVYGWGIYSPAPASKYPPPPNWKPDNEDQCPNGSTTPVPDQCSTFCSCASQCKDAKCASKCNPPRTAPRASAQPHQHPLLAQLLNPATTPTNVTTTVLAWTNASTTRNVSNLVAIKLNTAVKQPSARSTHLPLPIPTRPHRPPIQPSPTTLDSLRAQIRRRRRRPKTQRPALEIKDLVIKDLANKDLVVKELARNLVVKEDLVAWKGASRTAHVLMVAKMGHARADARMTASVRGLAL
ncbi:hypothetical protein Pst134EA_031309 [Puccinia striiformis f. sp. tritici]|uniref:uncharacterized protein n=1 Tax=Puccinia striiformis f. sp. tritici TaxID=168172 RepID=UPI00200895E5|nr:uncharacterized protein Pst134EA_031309 [Puccinia striiformis f. sp. tritici]KAH9445363.1 hypothetical protein Pst134EA_031309 [Puccinia striiformis f. sp. tritici]